MKKALRVGSLELGKGLPIRVESMLKVNLRDSERCLAQLEALKAAGCEMVRVAYESLDLQSKLDWLVQRSPMPLMADIHFDPRLAMSALNAGVPSIRINPGNMGDPRNLEDVLRLARDKDAVIRIGANSGSINDNQIAQAGGDKGLALALAVGQQADMLLDKGFDRLIISAKSTDVNECLRANQLLHRKYADFPFHIGITEAGSGMDGIIKSACGIALLLKQGIGDTLRVSLSQDPVDEVKAGYSILRALDLRHRGACVISCPTCGRRQLDVISLLPVVRPLVERMPDGFVFAVMGCEVNGPREAKGADLGVAGSAGGIVIFKDGRVVGRCAREDLEGELEKFLPLDD